MAYWHVLKTTWPKKLHWKLSSKFKTSHLTIDLKAIIVIFKFEPWSLTCKQWFFFLNPYWLKKIVRLLAKDWLVAYVVSKKPIIICLSCQSHPKRLMTTNILCALLDIHKSNLTIVEIQSINFGKNMFLFCFLH